MFESIIRNLSCRDQAIGWSQAQKNKTRHLVVVNSCFVIFDGVKIRNLASMALAMAARRLADDRQQKYDFRPLLLETFVDTSRFTGSCYRAAGWQRIGQTKPRQGKTQKDVYWKPLVPDFKRLLCRQPRHPAPNQARQELRQGAAIDPQIVQTWQPVIATTTIAAAYDAKWQGRRRAINSLLIILFVFRLVIAPNRQGYAITLSQLWRQCQTYRVPLYQPQPVSAAAVDGSKFN